ncbi:MAG: hypothetical protein COZ06_38085 [Armatimonadetes bacterium CG_4_10_14_3_um_filter_66_18]|nr:hypothetical protein [Armatimonadota bacterium]OIO93101.1 MAG: hypothetical protein AUJ96_30960 [Armatimonadetes bacterium CG2_30_66_41]PIU87780.1 MAG: hypothetical protein COS65_32985 [Armatimonadetes bacterium CG06_land_8_20_14_3_00_66_21]PIX37690.1 MAG: hypothetical protein COZ57_32970 [Armatimonadetes bacterium CG_4_8_14_3_um_filter_66_20]PIY35547.1 MAG: hypothetical protein COZ06_38085 [Armatimonadetes bacterium CG_4_10_14_3_um_filter_66_18]PIZ48628.1 MAG: hypothetical protein COY42_06
MARRKKWTRKRILLTIRKLHEAGEDLTVQNVQRLGLGGMVGAVYKDPALGSWKEVLEAAGIDLNTIGGRRRKWTPTRVLDEIHKRHQGGKDLSHRAVRQERQYLVVAAVEFFGSWEDALRAAGLDYDEIRKQETWTKAKILRRIRELAAAGEDLSYGAITQNHSPLAAAAGNRRHFGSWGEAIEAAGIKYDEVRRHREPWDRERIIATIRELHARGEDLITTNIRKLGYRTMEYAARRQGHFGSWRGAIEAAGLDFDEVTRLDKAGRRKRHPKVRLRRVKPAPEEQQGEEDLRERKAS